jgi:glycosyltransferase involved in cell wall biosynthesis
MMNESFTKFENPIIIGVSEWISSRAMISPILFGKKILTIENGIDTSVFKPTDYSELLEKHFITEDQKIILHVTSNFNNPIKGGEYVIEIAKKFANCNVKILIVGFNGDESSLPSNVIPVYHTYDQNHLAKYYSMADVTLLTSKSETYSMICAESLSFGSPVVGFKARGPETISLKDYSDFVEQGETEELVSKLKKWLFLELNLSKKIS